MAYLAWQNTSEFASFERFTKKLEQKPLSSEQY